MAHNIQERDSQHGLKQAWHNKTIVHATLTRDIVFPYTIIPAGLIREDGGKLSEPLMIPVASDDNLPVGNPFNPDSYTLRTPHEDWDLLMAAFEGSKFTVTSGGTVADRRKYFISLHLDELTDIKAGDRTFQQYLNCIGSFDGQIPATFTQSAHDCVCENTVNAALFARSEFKVRIRHTKNMKSNMIEVEHLLEQAFGIAKIFSEAMGTLAEVPCKPERANRIYAGFLTPANDDSMSSRTANTVGRLTEMQSGEKAPNGGQYGFGNRGETMLDTLSAFTQFRTRGFDVYGDRTDRPMSQFQSSEFGLGSRQKAEFAQLLSDKKALATIERRGKEILSRPVRTRDVALSAN